MKVTLLIPTLNEEEGDEGERGEGMSLAVVIVVLAVTFCIWVTE